MESQQFTEEEGRNYVSSSSDDALPGIVSEKKHLTNSNFDVSPSFRMRRRAILKDGYTNMFNSNVPLAGLTSITQDFFTFMMECRWRTLLLLFFTSFLISWLIFAALYWAVAFGHGDLRDYEELHDPTKEPCVTMMDDFISCFLFSMETQYSSGYGTRSPTTECPDAMFLVGFQSIFGALLQLSMSGIIFAKLARPKMRQQAILFSHKAVISLRDRSLCLMFRVGDCRKSRLLGANIYARLLQHRVSAEGEKLPHYQHVLKLSVDSSGSDIFLLWPLTAVHRIDSTSPLYDISADDLASATFELFVVLSGTVETMGQDTEARTSYTASEILWGHRLVPLVKTCGRGYILDYSRFHTTVAVDTPRCSARQLYCWTHNYVLLNKAGLLGQVDGFMEEKKGFLGNNDGFSGNKDGFLGNKDGFSGNKDGFPGNKDGFSGNKDGFLEKDKFLGNKDGFSDNKEGVVSNKDGVLEIKDEFLDSDRLLMDNRDRLSGNEERFLENKDNFFKTKDEVLRKKYEFFPDEDKFLNNKDRMLCDNCVFLGIQDESSEKNRFPEFDDKLLDGSDKVLSKEHALLRENDGSSPDKSVLLAYNDRFSKSENEFLGNTDRFSTGGDEFLNRKDEYCVTKGVFSGKSGIFVNKEGFLDEKYELSISEDQYFDNKVEFLGKNELTEYREENETARNLTDNSSGPGRKFSTILKEGPERDLHNSLMSLLDKKQRTRLTTLSEDDLR